MLVKALRLRYMGHGIPTDVLRQEQPMTGELTYGIHLHGRSMTAMQMPLADPARDDDDAASSVVL